MLHLSLYHRDYFARLPGDPLVEARRNPHCTLVARLCVEAPAHSTALPEAVDLSSADTRLTALRDDAIDALQREGSGTGDDLMIDSGCTNT